MNDERIINCHTHIFTADHVPPFLAKTYVPAPFHILLPLAPVVAFFRWWYKGPAKLHYTNGLKKMKKTLTAIHAFFNRLYPVNIIAGYYIFLLTLFTLYNLLMPGFPPEKSWVSKIFHKAFIFLSPFFPVIASNFIKILLVVFVFIFFESIRNLLVFFANLLWKFLSKLPGKNTRELAGRYLNIGRYAFHRKQATILSKLKDQYPKGTGFIVLPMDMDFMGAGKSKIRYRDQMKSLAEVKAMPSNRNVLFPFVFADPRRFVNVKDEKDYKAGDKQYFDWYLQGGKVRLGDCFIRDYIEVHGFSGIKIYPALGYYPFDEKLLPLWKYAAENNIPVLTHCIKGTIFYRGRKKDEWNAHPVFEQAMACETDEAIENKDGFKNDEEREEEDTIKTEYVPLVLPQFKNVAFSYNFTHPMNYLCLLEEPLLRKLIAKAKANDPQSKLIELFGYNGTDKPMDHNLRNLKICLGHFGGDDEWKRYFEKDRYNYSSQLTKNPKVGIKFFETVNRKPAPGKPEQIWKYTDWYSIICSMMLQYPNVYADISYILHSNQDILPLLIQTLQNDGLKEKVLYGTDFFVVRNHKSDKNMLADMMGYLPEKHFDQIARVNGKKYLENTIAASGNQI